MESAQAGSRYGTMKPDEEQPPLAKPAHMGFGKGPRRPSFFTLMVCMLIPWIEFSVVCAVLTFKVQLAGLWVTLLFLLLLVLAAAVAWAWRHRGEVDGTLLLGPAAFCFAMSLAGWTAGLIIGKQNVAAMDPYFQFADMAVYVDVDPSKTSGQQVMDAGRIFFEPGARLDVQRSMGFKNGQVYCVAPVVLKDKKPQAYDFWAVGVGCCSGASPDFHCPGYHDPRAFSGLRLTDDGQRPYFRLAVQEAEAKYGIKAPHPIFLHWMRDPTAALDVYRDKATSRLNVYIWSVLVLQVFFVGAIVFVSFKD